jgi:hypothetical protein
MFKMDTSFLYRMFNCTKNCKVIYASWNSRIQGSSWSHVNFAFMYHFFHVTPGIISWRLGTLVAASRPPQVTQLTQLSSEICPEVKLGDSSVFFVLITDLKFVLWYHLNFPRNRHIYSRKCLQSVVYRRGQADKLKQKACSSLSVMTPSWFQGAENGILYWTYHSLPHYSFSNKTC